MTDPELAAEASQYSWAAQGLTAAVPDPVALNYDTRPTSAQLADARAQIRTLRQQQNHLLGLLRSIARTLGADPHNLDELPALVDGCRTARDQLAIREADLKHTLARIKQADLDRLKAHLGINPGQAVGIALVPHDQGVTQDLTPRVDDQGTPLHASDLGDAPEEHGHA